MIVQMMIVIFLAVAVGLKKKAHLALIFKTDGPDHILPAEINKGHQHAEVIRVLVLMRENMDAPDLLIEITIMIGEKVIIGGTEIIGDQEVQAIGSVTGKGKSPIHKSW